MDLLNEPKRKRTKLKPGPSLPNKRYTAIFNGFSVVVRDKDAMNDLVTQGFFGKANLSRTYPQFKKQDVLRQRIWENRQKFAGNHMEKVVVVPDSEESEDEEQKLQNYFTNLTPKYEFDRSGLEEQVSLLLEEAFFLHSALGILTIEQNNLNLNSDEIWRLFSATDQYFVPNYVAYYHFRAKNWVVKPGMRFGADFILYKQGPPFYHASYVVLIENFDVHNKRLPEKNRHLMDLVALKAVGRVSENSNKQVIICQIFWPELLPSDVKPDLKLFKVKEILVKRWIPSQARSEV